MNRTEIINSIIKEREYYSYLEIGLGDSKNFRNVNCEMKVGIDPEVSGKDIGEITSDEFFIHNKDNFDLIFIDGFHHSEQVERDILNSWKWVNKGGLILIHDVRPFNEKSQRVPRETLSWMGDVWRAWYGLKNTYPKLKTYFIEERAGIGAIEKTRHKISSGFIDNETEYEYYNSVKGWEV